MYEDRDQLLRIARDVVVTAMEVPVGEDRMLVALEAIVRQVGPSRIDAFWVALIEHSMEAVRPFLAVYGDELLAAQKHDDDPEEPASLGRPVDMLNGALAYATKGDYEAVEGVIEWMLALEEHERNTALANIVHAALTLGQMMRSHHSGQASAS
ncbi:hypothetical protein [Nocardia sp. NRRL S-836]|uniref:hypothetical protein n=1 Tax=Nocardia sp. NRRL S-836 TaxID=1519492 RepID=UPI0006AE5CD1|nr:hypothetical protein [Nocardia sp. NRRL S-836]KOV87580.1 hypothetical protein ADL03_06710 [Nocardia sp. NRRL S-836]